MVLKGCMLYASEFGIFDPHLRQTRQSLNLNMLNEVQMFLIAGVTPKTKVLDNTARRCPVCGLHQAYLKRVDHYFNLFFIPIVRVKKGEPFVMCERCERTVHEPNEEYNDWPDIKEMTCRHCGKTVDKSFKYCPHCGNPI
ncbi:MAG: zinc ribbon domain-containing protein [Desulfobacterales bacterium]